MIEGQNICGHVAEKYGSTKEHSVASRARMTKAGAEVGLEFRYFDDMRMQNTFYQLQFLHWDERQGRMRDLKMELFAAHFTHGRNLSDHAVLAEVDAEIGLERNEALAVLADQRFAAEVP